MDYVSLIQTLGFPIAVATGMAWFAYTFITRFQDEAKEREGIMRGTISDATAAMKEATKINSELAKTNDLLANEIRYSLDRIQAKLEGVD